MRWTSAPASTSSAASRSAFGVVFAYWKRPVSVTSAMYSASASSGVSSTPSSRIRSRRISPVDEASATTRLICPKRLLSWWWSTLMTSGADDSAFSPSPSRLSLAQSSANNTRSSASSGSSRRRSARGMNLYSAGSGAAPGTYMTASLPSWSSTSLAARIDPSASPSGFSWVTSRKRFRSRSASATALRSLVVWGELIDQVRHPDAALDGRIVFEGQLRGPFQPQLPGDAGLENAVRGLQPGQRRLALALRAVHADEDLRVAKVGGGLDPGDGDEADPRVAELADGFGEDFENGRIDAAHPVTHRGAYRSSI